MLKVATAVLLGVASVSAYTDGTCDETGRCGITSLSGMQEVILRSMRELIKDPSKSTPQERLNMFEVWQLTNPDAEATQKWYNLWAKTYDSDMVGASYVNPLSVADEVVAGNYPLDYKILDIGAGSGRGGLELQEKGFKNIDACDGNPEMLAVAKKTGAYQNFHRCLAPTDGSLMCDIEDGAYDLVTSSGAIYPFHLMGHHLASMVTTVKVGGHLILSGCPYNDVNVNMRAAARELEAAGVVLIRKEQYIDDWFIGYDGFLLKLERLK